MRGWTGQLPGYEYWARLVRTKEGEATEVVGTGYAWQV